MRQNRNLIPDRSTLFMRLIPQTVLTGPQQASAAQISRTILVDRSAGEFVTFPDGNTVEQRNYLKGYRIVSRT